MVKDRRIAGITDMMYYREDETPVGRESEQGARRRKLLVV